MTTSRLSLYYDKSKVADFSGLVSAYDPDEFASPTRSTVPLLSMVRDAPDMLGDLLSRLGFSAAPSLHFEYTVQSPRGRGLPSHTDVMARSEALQLALEFKWTEPRYPTVRQWLGNDPEPPNKTLRLTGWLDLLQTQASLTLKPDDFSDVVYQMVHRAASACESITQPRLAYVAFKHEDCAPGALCTSYADDLRRFRSLLGDCPRFSFHLAEVTIKPTALFRRIEALRKRAESTKTAVRNALLSGGLFEFLSVRHAEI